MECLSKLMNIQHVEVRQEKFDGGSWQGRTGRGA